MTVGTPGRGAEWILTLDRSGCISHAGPGCDALTDLPASVLAGLPMEELIGAEHRAACRAALDSARGGVAGRLEFRAPPPLDAESWYAVFAPVLAGDAVVAISVAARGLSAEKRMEADIAFLMSRLAEAEKLEVVGRIAAGVAHDFNNLLTIIVGMGSLLKSGLEGTREEVYIQEILKAGDRAARLTRELLAFSRRDEPYVTVLDLNSVLAQVDPLLRRVMPKDVELACITGTRLGPVRADQVRIEELVLTLALNARDAMPDGGRLLIQSFNRELTEPLQQFPSTVPPGVYSVVAVSDNGCGIGPDMLPHIFEPLTALTVPASGVGPGLAAAAATVREAGGHIVVHSDPGAGSTFMVFLPHVAGAPASAAVPTPARAAAERGSETVLVVDDEDPVRLFVTHVLLKAGYSVVEAKNGEEALRIMDSRGDRIDVVLSDVMMPLMGGREFADRLATEHPALPLIFMTGCVADRPASPGPGMQALISKPFTPELLLLTVRSTLDGLPPDTPL
jgi:two-component system, cell cycle sensor histidine kinase and response regulator CckA